MSLPSRFPHENIFSAWLFAIRVNRLVQLWTSHLMLLPSWYYAIWSGGLPASGGRAGRLDAILHAFSRLRPLTK
jgi:hypothetical protein